MKKGFNMEEIKNKNIKLILSYLRTYGPSSRKIIASNLDLTTASLTNITNELIKEELVIELGEVNEGKVGRKQILIDLNPESKIALGLEIRDKKISFTSTNIKAEILKTEQWSLQNENPIIELEKVMKYIEDYIEDKKDKILGIGILVPGYIENEISKNSRISDIKKRIEERLKIKTYIENNIRALVRAELYLEKKYNNFWLVSYGPGLGSGIVLNGEILKGNKAKSGEIGHIPMPDNTKKRICPICKQIGCLESEIHFDTIINQLLSKNFKKNNGESDIEFFKRILKESNYSEIKSNLEILARYISIGFSLLDPEKIILSGEIFSISELYNYLVDKIHEYNNLINTDDIEYMSEYVYKRTVAGSILVLSDFFK